MLIYLYFDALDQLEPDRVNILDSELVPVLKKWHEQQEGVSLLIDSRNADSKARFSRSHWDLGLLLDIRRAKPLKKPLDYLNSICHQYQQLVAVGFWDDDKKMCEDVCFFGYEEADADLFEIASYLGLKP